MALYLGIDGGGSQTTCAVADETHVLGTGSGGGCNPVRFDDGQVRRSIHDAVRQACSEATIDPKTISFSCLGIAGSAREDTRVRVEQIAREVVGGKVQVVGDMVVAHDSVFPGQAGVIVLSGTGSIAFGRNERGETARVGGWGSVISDEGSGYWIGRRAVTCVMRAVDAGESTNLTARILHEWHIATREELGRICNAIPYPDFAKLFPLVLKSAEEGDGLARQILEEASTELAVMAKIVLRKLWLGPKQVRLAISGGVFQNSDQVRMTFERIVQADRPDAEIRLAEIEPVLGAIYLARKMARTDSRA